MDKKLIKQYAKLNADIEALEARKTEVKIALMESMEKEGIDKVETAFGKLSRAVRRTFTYSDKVKALEEKVKVAKAKEEQKGIAKAKESPYLVFTKPENDE